MTELIHEIPKEESQTRDEIFQHPLNELEDFLEAQYLYHGKSESAGLDLPNPYTLGIQETNDRCCQPLWHVWELCNSRCLGRSSLGGLRAASPEQLYIEGH
jgi:hypothetical protein